MPSSLGGGAIVAFAAALWLLYLTPIWVRRRRYVQTERNAVRLQRTLENLAAPDVDDASAEATAKLVIDQHLALREAARTAERFARPTAVAAERRIARDSGPRDPRRRADAVSALAQARLRRSRVLGGNIILLGLAAVGFGVWQGSTGGPWWWAAAGVVASLGGVALLQRAATVAAAHRAVVAVDRAVTLPTAHEGGWDSAGEQEQQRWAPVAVPRPLSFDRDEPDFDEADLVQVEAELAAATQASEQARRLAQARAAAIDRPASVTGTPRFSSARINQDTGEALRDLDGVLRRRRAG